MGESESKPLLTGQNIPEFDRYGQDAIGAVHGSTSIRNRKSPV